MTTADMTFSVVVNTTDRAYPLRTLLRALEQQSYPHFEVVVVVGPTRDDTLEMLQAYEGRVRIMRCPKANLGQSRNVGLLAARGDVVAYIDDDAVPCIHWLAQLARLFRNPDLAATGGVVYLTHPDHAIIQHRLGIISSLAEQEDVRISWMEYLPPPGEGSQWVARMMGTNMAYRRSALLEIGGFDEFFEWVFDDSDVAMRMAQAGKTIFPLNEAVVYHIPASSRNRQAFSYHVRWWIPTKAALYFIIKHGSTAGDSVRKMTLRCLHLVHGRFLWYEQLRKDRHITFWQALGLQLQNLRALCSGVGHGLFSSRKLLDNSSDFDIESDENIMVFQNEQSRIHPPVDPVSGKQAVVSSVTPPLRICLLSSAYPPAEYEGVGRHTHLMARGLFECGHTVHVIARGEREEVSFYDGAYVHRIPDNLQRYPRERYLPMIHGALNYSHSVYDKVKRLILNDGIQLVDSPLWQIEGLVTAISAEVPVVLRLQTAHRQIGMIERKRDADLRMIGELEQSLIEHASYWVPNSLATVRAISKVYNINPSSDRYTIIPHGIVPVAEEAIRPFDLTHTPDTLTVLYVGRLEKRKGIQDLFGAIPRVIERCSNVRFIIAGKDNSMHDGFLRRTGLDYPTYFVRHYAQYANYVQFLGVVSEELLYQLYQSCDLFVAPSLYESFGLIYIEAMNYAKPVIGCAAGGIPEVVEHGVTGLLVEPEAASALAEALLDMLLSPIRLYEMGMAGRQRLLENFTHIQMAQRFAEVYRRVLYSAGASLED